jgi:hypothetical protein
MEGFVVHFLRLRFRRSAISAASEPSATAVTAAIFQIALDELTFSLPRKKYETSIKSTASLSHRKRLTGARQEMPEIAN